MKSTIRVHHDFDHNEPYLQLRLDGHEEDEDIRDLHLKHMMETANGSLLYVWYSKPDNNLPQVRVLTPYSTTEECMQIVISNFETFARQYFQEGEMEHVNNFFKALKVKAISEVRSGRGSS